MNRLDPAGVASSRLAHVVPSRAGRVALGIFGFVVLTALSARISIPIPGTVIPFTFQVFAVLLSGVLLGARLGAASQVAYLAAGAAGVPVFAVGAGAAYLLGPTGGYLLAYPLAAFVAGSLAGGSLLRVSVASLAGLAVIYAGGLSWLAAVTSWEVAALVGLKPFLLPDLVKVALVVLVAHRYRDSVRRFLAF